MIKAVIFDYDETLVKTLDSRIPAYIDLARDEYGLTLTPQQIRAALGKPYEEFIKTLFGDVDKVESIISKYQAMIQNYPMLPYEGAVDAVTFFLRRYKVGILSGVRWKLIVEDLKRLKFPIDEFFYVQCGDDTTVHKPDPHVFDPLTVHFKTIHILPADILYVGDDMKDYEAATKAGLQFVAISGHTTKEEVFKSVHAHSVRDFSALIREYSGDHK